MIYLKNDVASCSPWNLYNVILVTITVELQNWMMYNYSRNLMDCIIANLKPCALKGLGWPRSVQAGAKINVSAVLNCNKKYFYS